MKNLPLVSVIIPVHNSEKFLKECLASVVAQTYSNLEILVVDDDSDDRSAQIIKEVCTHDKRVRYFKTKKHNAAFVRKLGTEKSTADYVCFVDSDDAVSREYVELLYHALVEGRARISICKTAVVYNNNLAESIDISRDESSRITVETDLLTFFCNNYHWKGESAFVAQSICGKMFTKELFTHIDYSVIKSNIFEDNFIISQLFKNTSPQEISTVDKTLYYYRMNPDSTMQTAMNKLISYGNSQVTYPELFEIAMSYIQQLYSENQRAEELINGIRVVEYYNLAQSVVEKTIQLRETKVRLQEVELDRDQQLSRIKNSNSYKIGRIISYPLRLIKRITATIRARRRRISLK